MSFHIYQLHASVQDKLILKGVDLDIKPGEMHVIMGPNGSGKSTLALTLAGHPAYKVIDPSEITLNGQDIVSMSPDERSRAGLFLAFQHPVEVPGVRVSQFLRLAYIARFGEEGAMGVVEFRKYLDQLAEELHIPKGLLKRGLNEGFSGGEKKRLELLQMAVLQPAYAILDETDSGLDIDAVKQVAEGVNAIVKRYNTGVLLITHYQRILAYLHPDYVHVMVDGRIIKSGGPELVDQLEQEGYATITE